MNAAYDVAVLGGGPAGATLAARLAALGHRVAVVEQRRFPRPHVGESLSPGIWPMLDLLGGPASPVRATTVHVRQTAVSWRDREELLPVRDGLTVDRGVFDAILLEHARAAGATVLAPARAGRPERTSDEWHVPLDGSVLHARFLADASGRRRLLGGPRTRTSPRTVALHARYPTGWSTVDGPQTRIAARPEGWLWAAQLPGGALGVMAFVDPETLLGAGGDAQQLFGRLLASCPGFAPLLDPPFRTGRVRVCDATSYDAGPATGEAGLKVGEAAFAIDPLSSSGVQTAMQTGLAAAATVHTLLTPGGDSAAALAYYRDQHRHSVRHHATTSAGLYAEHARFAEERFWRRRSAQAPPAPRPTPAPADLADLLPHPVRLRAPAVLRDVPCLVADHIERRRALSYPALDRPVAFLGALELAPLLDELASAPSLAAALRRWDHCLPPGRGRQVASWLHRHGLLEAAPRGAPGMVRSGSGGPS